MQKGLTTQQIIQVAKASLEGATIERMSRHASLGCEPWTLCDSDSGWDFANNIYRIRPKPKIIPFTQQTFPVDALLSFNGKNWYKATTIGLDFITVGGANYTYNSLKDPEIKYSVDGGKTWQPAGQIINE